MLKIKQNDTSKDVSFLSSLFTIIFKKCIIKQRIKDNKLGGFMKKKFKISVIIPVYNVYDYLRETIESVVHQDIGFKNIELILMNDGSPDNSEEICLEYKEKYPDNVIYVKKENSGVSDTRNKGMDYATGEYIHFLDSDDKISKNFYRVGYNFMKKHNVKLCFYRIRQFDAKTSLHNLDWKFKGKKDRA